MHCGVPELQRAPAQGSPHPVQGWVAVMPVASGVAAFTETHRQSPALAEAPRSTTGNEVAFTAARSHFFKGT
ncbi:hypothetical protein CTRI78_v004468 [Colletotrichum trifolii]|uniref:Uncharacterized protein n=1 Tax=Colletotrichum trifolii TaxID=5466 RepID=A0A4R8RHH6_COLTR|nr:hypothetical protein CTRI78_v004468 [Colletotrichum trifolii]